MSKNQVQADLAATITKLNANNAEFYIKNGFPAMNLMVDGEKKEYERVFLHRAFPFEMLWQYISVLDGDGKEIGVIYNVEDFGNETCELLKNELKRKYYEPHVKTILSLNERYGFSYWNIITKEDRKVSFTMQDTFRNIIRVGSDKAILLDVDGNRFVIESIAALDRKSYKKIELYL